MAAGWMRFRSEVRSRWRSWLIVAVLAGVAGGFVLTAAAGARRTHSALARHLVAFRFPDAWITVENVDQDNKKAHRRINRRVRSIPYIEASAVTGVLSPCARDAHNRAVSLLGPEAVHFLVNLDGRIPDQRRPREALVDTRAAKRFDVRPGGMILIRDITDWGPGDLAALHCDPRNDPVGPLIGLRVVGISAATRPYPIGTVTLTRAFDRAYGLASRYSDFSIPVKLLQGAADIPALAAAAGRTVLPEAADAVNVLPEAADAAKIQRSIDHQAQALWLAAGFGALLALLLLAPALLRLATLAATAHPTLQALGMTRQEVLMVDVARAAAIGAVAASLSVAFAVAFSPLMPIGLARDLEPAPGLSFDPFVLGLGSAGVFLAVALAGAFTTSQARTAPAEVRRARSCGPADALARWGLPATAASGVRLELTRARGTTAVPIGGTLLGAIASVTVVAVTLTFTASMDHLLSTPRLYGQNWDYRTNYEVPPAAQLRADPSIGDAAAGAEATVRLDGQEVRVLAMDDIKGRIGPVI